MIRVIDGCVWCAYVSLGYACVCTWCTSHSSVVWVYGLGEVRCVGVLYV